jgi:hypothetical protein
MDERSLTGVWSGQYSYRFWRRAVDFTAHLVETNGALWGSTEETVDIMGRPQILAAMLDGARHGSAVAFRKSYDHETRSGRGTVYRRVDYRGQISADGSQIEGSWRVAAFQSGRFVMIRAPGSTAEAKEDATISA